MSTLGGFCVCREDQKTFCSNVQASHKGKEAMHGTALILLLSAIARLDVFFLYALRNEFAYGYGFTLCGTLLPFSCLFIYAVPLMQNTNNHGNVFVSY